MRIGLFLAFLAASVLYAAWRGAGPERTMAAIAVSMVCADQMLHLFVPTNFVSVDAGHLMIDIFGAASTIMLALFAHRFWPMCMAVLHMVPMLAHSTRMLDLTLHPAAYLTMQVATSWGVPPLLILATWRHRRRLARGENEPSWLISSAQSIPTTA